MKFLQNSNESNTELDEISVEEEGLFIKRSTIGFISAGVACSILSFGAFALTAPQRTPTEELLSGNPQDDAIAIQLPEKPQQRDQKQVEQPIAKTETRTIVTEANSSSVPISQNSSTKERPTTTQESKKSVSKCKPKTNSSQSEPQNKEKVPPMQATSPEKEPAPENNGTEQNQQMDNPFEKIDKLVPKKD